jgi:asparagine synthetase B (glutamine-hydrolysing)
LHAFVMRHTWRPTPFEKKHLEGFRWASPIKHVNEYAYQSRDARTWAVFHEIPTRLFPAGASYHRDGDGVTFFDGHLWPVRDRENHLPEMATFLRAKLHANTVETVQSEMNGEYALVHVDEEHDSIVALCDPVGLTPLYYAEDPEGFVISNRIHAIQALLGGETEEFALSTLAHLASWGHIPPGKTVLKGIEEFGGGCVLQASKGKLSIQRNPRPYHDLPGCDMRKVTPELWDDAIEEMSSNLRFLRHCPDIYPQLGLSGGKDSRLILSLAINEQVAEKILPLTQGLDSHPDVIVAKEITERFSLPHRIQYPSDSDTADSVQCFDDAMPAHMWHSEGMLNLFEQLPARGCGADPVLSGLNGDNFRSDYDLHGHKTQGVVDARSAKAFLEQKTPLNTSGLVHRDIENAHRAELRRWVDHQLELGITPEDLPSLRCTMFRSLRRNCNFKKIHGYWHHPINVLTGNKLYWLASKMGVEDRRMERIHFEVMKRTCPWLLEHHFADQAWDKRLFEKYAPPRPVTASKAEQEKINRADWRTHIDTEPRFKKRVMDFMMNVPSASEFWHIIDRDCLEDWFKQKEHGHMSRFHFYGALTLAMVVDKRRNEVKMEPLPPHAPVLVRQEEGDAVYAACQGKIRAHKTWREFLSHGGKEEDVYTFPPKIMQRFELDAPSSAPLGEEDVITRLSGFHNPESNHVWMEKRALFVFEKALKNFSFSLKPSGQALEIVGSMTIEVRNTTTGEVVQHTFRDLTPRTFTIDAPLPDQTIAVTASDDYCPADHGGSDTRRLAVMFFDAGITKN